MRNPKAQQNAIRLRKEMTDAERHLWRHLRLRQMKQCKFRRQYPIGPFVADFACLEQNLIIELDGGQHTERENYDARREQWLQKNGYRVIRFWNDQVLKETDAVLEVIWAALRPHPHLPPQAGEGI